MKRVNRGSLWDALCGTPSVKRDVPWLSCASPQQVTAASELQPAKASMATTPKKSQATLPTPAMMRVPFGTMAPRTLFGQQAVPRMFVRPMFGPVYGHVRPQAWDHFYQSTCNLGVNVKLMESLWSSPRSKKVRPSAPAEPGSLQAKTRVGRL